MTKTKKLIIHLCFLEDRRNPQWHRAATALLSPVGLVGLVGLVGPVQQYLVLAIALDYQPLVSFIPILRLKYIPILYIGVLHN